MEEAQVVRELRCAQGCGKTIEVLALVLSNPAPPQIVSGTVRPDKIIESRWSPQNVYHGFRLPEIAEPPVSAEHHARIAH